MTKYLMACGCVAQGVITGTDKPVCAIHDCLEVVRECEGNEGLEGRKAVCSYGDNTVDSRWNLPFFMHRPNMETDEYYCGCWGWD